MANYRVPVLENFEWQQPVLDRLATPPGTPAKGDRYLVIATGTGDWTGHEKDIAYCSNATGPVWTFTAPSQGMMTWVKDENEVYVYNSTNAWVIFDVTGTSGYSGYSGASGASGAVGADGTSGYSGTSGAVGVSGTSGAVGTSGYSGASGTSGIGTSGYSGTSGVAGISGTSGYSGPGATYDADYDCLIIGA